MKIFCAFLFVLPALASGAEAFKCKGPDGEMIFSDKPCENAEAIELREPQTFHNEKLKQLPKTRKPREIVYSQFEITSPTAGQIFEDGSGNVSITVSVKPRLAGAHQLQLFLNNAAHGEAGKKSNWSFTDMDRGEYTARVDLVDDKGKVLQSASTPFVVIRRTARR